MRLSSGHAHHRNRQNQIQTASSQYKRLHRRHPRQQSSLHVLLLAFKHRLSKNQKPRIVMFIASSVEIDHAELVKLSTWTSSTSARRRPTRIFSTSSTRRSTAKRDRAANWSRCGDDNEKTATADRRRHLLTKILNAKDKLANKLAQVQAARDLRDPHDRR